MDKYLSKLAAQIQQNFIARNLTLSCAESCTGGLLASLLTEQPGASNYFKAGLVTYSNFAKSKFLNIALEVILKEGAVSEEVAKLMAQNCRISCQTDIAVAITGIAGPQGDEKVSEVGLVYIAYSEKNLTKVEKFNFSGDRSSIRNQSITAALEIILYNS